MTKKELLDKLQELISEHGQNMNILIITLDNESKTLTSNSCARCIIEHAMPMFYGLEHDSSDEKFDLKNWEPYKNEKPN